MATGDFVIFNAFLNDIATEGHNLDSDNLKLGIVDNSSPPTASSATPNWGAHSANEVTAAGNYTADGVALASSWIDAVTATAATLDASDITISQDATNGFTNAYWGVLYNDSHATDAAIGYVDLGGPVSEQDGDVKIQWNASGILKLSKT